MISQTYSKRRSGGFSLLELLLVVAVGAVLILAGLGAYRLVTENNNTNQATRLLTTIKQQVQQTYQGQSTYGTGGSLIPDLISMRALPTDLGVASATATTAKGPFGDVTITGNGNQFSITFKNVPKGACVRLGQQFTPQNSSDFVSLSAAGTSFDQTKTTISQADMLGACKDNVSSNTMIWTFQ